MEQKNRQDNNPLIVWADLLTKTCSDRGVDWIGVLPFPQNEDEYQQVLHNYEDWLSRGFSGDMKYLKNHLPLKKNPHLAFPKAKSIWLFSKSYLPSEPEPSFYFNQAHSGLPPHSPLRAHILQPPTQVFHPLKSARIALYAQEEDYHIRFRHQLNQLKPLFQNLHLILDNTELERASSENFFYAGTDSLPLMEKTWAWKAGGGWIGKNTCLIHPKKGSFFFLGEILSSISLPEKSSWYDVPAPNTPVHNSLAPHSPTPNHCGKCQRCLEICPTNAIIAPYVLDATRCISYWTIESQSSPPLELREKMGDWFFGCDLCQTVCPWNRKKLKPLTGSSEVSSHLFSIKEQLDLSEDQRRDLVRGFRWIFNTSSSQIKKTLQMTPLSRKKKSGLMLNALRVIGQKNLFELCSEVEQILQLPESADPRVLEMAKWALKKIKSS